MNTNIFLLLFKINFKKNIKLKQTLINFNNFKVKHFQTSKITFIQKIGPMLLKLDTTGQNSVQQKYSLTDQTVSDLAWPNLGQAEK